MPAISFKVSDNTKEKMIEYFMDKKRSKTPPYAIFQADEADTVVTLYESGKVVFQGVSADIDAELWKQTEKNLNPFNNVEIKKSDTSNKKEKKDIYINPKIYNSTTIGSDEVGCGDFFGPIVVTSAYVNKNNIKWLEELGIKDSKKMEDSKILDIVPELIKRIPYKSYILNNTKYNELYNDHMNMNKIKAILHNKVLLELTSEYKDTDYVIVDEFVNSKLYFNYLKNSPNVYKNITFITKAESKSLSVACASVISRYIFLKEFDKLSDNIGIILPKGACNLVDETGVKIIEKYDFNKLKDIAKLNFRNTEKIKALKEKL